MTTAERDEEYRRQHPLEPGQRVWKGRFSLDGDIGWDKGRHATQVWPSMLNVGQIRFPTVSLEIENGEHMFWTWCDVAIVLLCLDGMQLGVYNATRVLFDSDSFSCRSHDALQSSMELTGYCHAFVVQLAGRTDYTGKCTVTLRCITETRPIFRGGVPCGYTDVLFAFQSE